MKFRLLSGFRSAFVCAKLLRPISCCHSTFLLFFTVKGNDLVSFSFLFSSQAAQTQVTREGCKKLHTIGDAPMSRYRRPLKI